MELEWDASANVGGVHIEASCLGLHFSKVHVGDNSMMILCIFGWCKIKGTMWEVFVWVNDFFAVRSRPCCLCNNHKV